MVRTIKNCHLIILMMAFIPFLFLSCVDQQYDLSQIDKEVVVLREIEMPVGNLKPISIADFLDLDGTQGSLISADANGEFQFAFDGNAPISASVTVPDFAIGIKEGATEERKLSLILPSFLAGLDVSKLEQLLPEYADKSISFEDITGKKASVIKSLQMDEDCYLPYFIKDVKEAEFDGEVLYEFSIAIKDNNGVNINSYGGAMYIEKGFTIDFPDWFVIRKNDSIDGYYIGNEGNNKNILCFDKDVKISADKPVVFSVFVSKLEVPAGVVVDGGKDSEGRSRKKIQIDVNDEKNMILLSGDVYVKTSDFKKVPASVEMNMALSVKTLDMKSALVSIDVEESFPDQSFTLPEVPEVLAREGVVIDLYDPCVLFNVNNQSPLDIYVSAHLHAYRNSTELMDIDFAENGQSAPLFIPDGFNGQIGYSRRGEGNMIALPEIGQLFRTVPDKFMITDLKVKTGGEYISVVPGQSVGCSLDYAFRAPLSFGQEFAVDLEYELKELNLDLKEVGLRSVSLTFDAVNTIPLTLDVQAMVVDAGGNPVNNLSIDVDGAIKAGSLNSPGISPISINVKSSSDGIRLEGLKLVLNASCPSEYQGVVVNKAQGLELRNVRIALPDGVSLDADSLFE